MLSSIFILKNTNIKMNSHLLNLPNDTLVRDILPQLPLSTLSQACSSSSRINELCKDEDLWMVRTNLEYSEFFNNKPNNMSWVNYYIKLLKSKIIPVYLNNNEIGNVNFIPDLFDLTLEQFLSRFTNINEPYYIIFGDDKNSPYILVREPENKIDLLPGDYKNITKIVIAT
jgi:hypothetical protein